MADSQTKILTTGMALNGKNVLVDDFPKEPEKFPKVSTVTIVSKYSEYEPDTEVDYTDLRNVTLELIALRHRLYGVRKELEIAERNVTKTKYAYESTKKRVFIGLSGGTEKSKEAVAELKCEQEYTDYLVAASVAKELQLHSRMLREDLDLLKEVSNNLRRQIDLN